MLLELHRPSPSPSLRFLARAPSPTPPPPSPSSGRATPWPNRPESKVHGRPPWMLRSKLRPARRSPSSGCPWPDSGCCKQPHTLLYQPQLAPFLFPAGTELLTSSRGGSNGCLGLTLFHPFSRAWSHQKGTP